jgi:glutathione S-transferase
VPSTDGSYVKCDETIMASACRRTAGWKLSGNGPSVARFAARGGPAGGRNSRKSFAAELADPYAASDDALQPVVDAALRVVCAALLDVDAPADTYVSHLKSAIPADKVDGTVSSLAYLRDRIGVPRDLPLAAARYLRAYLNWGIDSLSS